MRLVTRGNLDGLACAVLIDHAERLTAVELTTPQAIFDESFDVQPGDILASLPYDGRCLKWFDYHSVTRSYQTPPVQFEGRYGLAPSTARLVYDYYLHDNPGFKLFDELIDETDRFHGAHLSIEDVTNPEGYALVGFTLDPRTGFDGFQDYFLRLLDTLRDGTLEEVLALSEVQRRAGAMAEERASHLAAMRRVSRLEGNVIVTDLRQGEDLPAGNRFLVYTLFPEANSCLRIAWGPNREFVTLSASHSPFNRSSTVHVGGLMSKYGGGGHRGAGATPLETDNVEKTVQSIVEKLNALPVNATL